MYVEQYQLVHWVRTSDSFGKSKKQYTDYLHTAVYINICIVWPIFSVQNCDDSFNQYGRCAGLLE